MSNKIFDEAFMKRLETVTLRFRGAVSGGYTGGRRSRNNGTTVEFSNFREYNQGDDFRRIDWNAYARFEKFFIKLFLDEKQINVRIFADLSASMGFGEPSKQLASMKLAAALAYISFRIRDNGEVYGLRDGKCEDLARGINSQAAFYRMLETLEALEPAGETKLDSSLKSCRGMHSGDGTAIVISDLMSDEDYRSAIDYLLYMRQQVILIHILSPEELDPQLEGQFRLEDSENGSYCDIMANRETLDCYRRALEEYREGIRSYCLSRGVTLMELRSDENPEDALLERGLTSGILN